MPKKRKVGRPKKAVAKKKVVKKTYWKWNSPLKAKMKRSGRRLVHGYETVPRKRKK